ncbi:MAG TPA: hypothetical protein VMX54_12605, partial [Vicinamibacteria bacterium]|nr:hypothetical protein [Vicinamibacteria bacterium]
FLGALVLSLGLVDIRRRPPGLPLAIAMVPPLLVPWAIVVRQPVVAGWSVELLIGAYYLLLTWALREKSPILLGIGLGLCLLSRYALAPWTLLLALGFGATGRLRQLLRAAGVTAAMLLVFYGLPFLARDPGILVRSYLSYGKGFEREWARPASDNHLYEGYGLAGWASDHIRGDSARRCHKVQQLHLVTSLVVCALLAPLLVRAARRAGDPYAPALYALKAALAVFYAFIPVPYPYLWVVPAIVSSQVVAAFVLSPQDRRPK